MYDPWTDRLSERLDGVLDASEAAALDEHLQDCVACRTILSDLQQVRTIARAQPDAPPPVDLWPGIAARIAAPATGQVLRLEDRRSPRWHVSLNVPQLAAAAVLVMLLSGGGVWLALSGTGALGPGARVADSPPPESAAVRLVSTETGGYETAIAELQRSLAQTDTPLDSSTVTVLRQSLAVIDAAIADARTALVQDPSNTFLHHHLDGAMKKKVDILRRAVSVRRAAS